MSMRTRAPKNRHGWLLMYACDRCCSSSSGLRTLIRYFYVVIILVLLVHAHTYSVQHPLMAGRTDSGVFHTCTMCSYSSRSLDTLNRHIFISHRVIPGSMYIASLVFVLTLSGSRIVNMFNVAVRPCHVAA